MLKHHGVWGVKPQDCLPNLCVLKDEIGIDAELGVETLGKGHGDASAATHNLTELGFIDAQQLGSIFLLHAMGIEVVLYR